MANLNIPFLLFQERSEKPFCIDQSSSRIEDEFLLLSDKNSGNLAICVQDSVITSSQDGRTTKFITNVRPKLLCMPSIYPEHPPVLHDFCFVKSPASKILSTSEQLLVTIHDDVLRLWNTDDGRNIMRSPICLFEGLQPMRIYAMQTPGIVLCFCQSKAILVIDVYTMTMVDKLESDHEGLRFCNFTQKQISVIDSKARIFTWEHGGARPSIKSDKKRLKQCSNLMLNQDSPPQFDFKLESVVEGSFENNDNIGGRANKGRGAHREILTYSKNMIVFQDRIEIAGPDKKVLLQYEQEILDQSYDVFSKKKAPQKAQKWFLSAFIFEDQIICIDNEFDLITYDISCKEQSRQNLFKDIHLFDLASKHMDSLYNKTLLQTQDELAQAKLQELKENMTENQKFRINNGLIYTYTNTQVIFWSIQSGSLPVHVNNIDVHGQYSNPHKDKNCLLNVNQFVSKNYFTRHQHSFFYSDERVTDQSFYISSDFPSMIIGTNYGRIFIIQLFQDIEGRSFPILVLDCHGGSPITCLYIAYSSARRKQNQSVERTSSVNLAQSISSDSGGNLIATSSNGTISIVNMNSGEIAQQLANFSIMRSEREKKRIDEYMRQREKNHRIKRRQSFCSNFSTTEYFNLVKVQPLKVFESCSFGQITKIVEVQILQQSQIERQKNLQQLAQDPAKLQQIHGFDAAPHGGAGQALFAEENPPLATAKKEFPKSADKIKEGVEKETQHLYNHHLQQIRDLSLSDGFGSQLSPLINELMPFKASYACLDTVFSAAYIFQISGGNCDLLKIQGLDSKPIGVYEDVLQNIVHVITDKDLNIYSYNKRSKQLIRKSNYAFTQSCIQMNQTILTLVEQQQYFKLAGKMQLHHGQKYDQYNFQQQFLDKGRKPGGHHKVLDYLSLSLQLPLYYHPHNLLSQKYTKSIRDMLPFREELRSHKDVKESLRKLIHQDFVWNDRYKSDFSQEYYQAQGAVTPMMTGNDQQMLIINTKDMINVFKSRMKVLTEFLGKMQGTSTEESETSQKIQEAPSLSADFLQNSKWPTRLLSLVHPFTLDENLDENLELFFGLSVPYIDFRIGVQGVDEAFSFTIDRDDKDKDFKVGENLQGSNSNQHYGETLKFLKQSIQIKMDREIQKEPTKLMFQNSEIWRLSPYMSSITSAYFLSTLVSIVEFSQADITTLLQDWLNVMQYITSNSSSKPLSVSSLSQLMLRKDHSVSSCARDVIMKPLLSSGSSIQHIKEEINQWQDLIMDTYLKLKEDSSMRQAYDGASGSLPQRQVPAAINDSSTGSESARQRRGTDITEQSFALAEERKQSMIPNQADKSINHFFGELEIRGLVNLSYYALYSQDGPDELKIDTDVQNRLCKCTVILTREIMTKFTINSKEHQNLLTILMQLLQTQMRAQVPTFKTKVIKEDVIKILLLIYDFYKKQLRDERFLTRVVAENFHLIHPKNSELYLKLTAAKTLLEIGTYFTEDFLVLIDEQATTLKDGPEYQRNVLDVLRYFINGSREGLEPYLIQIVQTLLKCLDPNDEQLRKNSTQLISIILSTMVKSFTMIAFHHETQRLAVGTPSGPIAIYDVRTSAKWKILEGHQKSVVCVEFDQKGNLLASYSSSDLTLRLWKVGNTGFFSTIMGGTGKSVKDWNLPPLKKPTNSEERKTEKISKVRQTEPKRPGANENFGKCKIKFVENEKVIELIREDGSASQHRIQK